jgi:hypothetical protein
MAEQELAVITRTYDLVLWACRHVGKFHRSHRFVLGERLERRLYELLETLLQARYTRDRQSLLRQANLSLEVLRFQMRLAKDLQCLKLWLVARIIDHSNPQEPVQDWFPGDDLPFGAGGIPQGPMSPAQMSRISRRRRSTVRGTQPSLPAISLMV